MKVKVLPDTKTAMELDVDSPRIFEIDIYETNQYQYKNHLRFGHVDAITDWADDLEGGMMKVTTGFEPDTIQEAQLLGSGMIILL